MTALMRAIERRAWSEGANRVPHVYISIVRVKTVTVSCVRLLASVTIFLDCFKLINIKMGPFLPKSKAMSLNCVFNNPHIFTLLEKNQQLITALHNTNFYTSQA